MKYFISFFCLFSCASLIFAQTNINPIPLNYTDKDLFARGIPKLYTKYASYSPSFSIVLKGLSYFEIACVIEHSESQIDTIKSSDVEYYVIRKLQNEGIQAVNVAKMKMSGRLPDACMHICIHIHYDKNLDDKYGFARAYYNCEMKISRICYIPDLETSVLAYVYSNSWRGYCSVLKARQSIEDMLDNLIASFLTDWYSVNKDIQTPAGSGLSFP